MDTKLKTNSEMHKSIYQKPIKTGKKIRAFLYRIIAVGALFTMIFSGIMGREALFNANLIGDGTLTGDIYYLSEFREYITQLYLQAMTGYAGAGDDNGFPLTDNNANEVARLCRTDFKNSIKSSQKDILFHLDKNGDALESHNISYPLFSEVDGHLLLPEDVKLCLYWNGPGNTLYFFGREYSLDYPVAIFDKYSDLQYRPNLEEAADMRLLIAVKEGDFFYGTLTSMAKLSKQYQQVLITSLVAAGLFLLAGFLCLFSRRAAKQMWQDYARLSLKLWAEVKLILLIGLYFICYNYWLWDLPYPLKVRVQAYPELWLYMPMGILFYLFFKDLTLNKTNLWRHSMLGSCIHYVKEYLCSLPWYRRVMILCTTVLCSSIVAFLCALMLLYMCITGYYIAFPADIAFPLGTIFLFAVGIALLFTYRRLRCFTRDTHAISTKLSQLREGTSDAPLILPDKSLLLETAADVNTLENGIEAAVAQQNRSNKMRVELITNVSHDLKTPLTSIINYADLLCGEELPATAAEYASALQAKAYRLKGMVQDVFELSKATSGNLPVEKTVLDLAKLMKQTLADMDERIADTSLTIKLNISTEPIFIEADGEKLYRIFQNLIVNALQYSLEHSRIHIQLQVENHRAYARIKNTSKQEIDFDPVEIVERFVRADSSRTTEGSGLGLSIVQSFTEACGGSFHITTDADMFTACVSFPLSEAPKENDNL